MKKRRWRVKCVVDQVSANDRRRLHASQKNRHRHDNDRILDDSDGKNLRNESVAQTRQQLVRPWPWRPYQSARLRRPSGSCRSISFGGAPWITRRQSQLESEPCEPGRNNASRRRAFTRLKTEREARQGKELPHAGGQTSDRCWCVEDAGQVQGRISLVRERAIGKHVQNADDGVASDERVIMGVFDSIIAERIDPKLLNVCREVELDFVSQFDESRVDDKQPKHRRKFVHERQNGGIRQSQECLRQRHRSSA